MHARSEFRARGFGIALLAYTGLVLVLFHQLIGRLSTAVPHDLGDPLLSTWILWWNAHHLPFAGPWWDGLAFFPVRGSLAFSDHRAGLELFAGPVQWLGGSPVLAYNITLLSSFVASALAAHVLTWTLTRSHASGAVSGVIFGFNPYRLSHIAHLELLAAFWLPLALAALHVYARQLESKWLCAFAALCVLQGLSSSYYLFYAAPVFALWPIWFLRERPWRGFAAVTIAGAAAAAALLPIFLRYRSIQDQLHLQRGFGEIVTFSADVIGLFSATPLMALWPLHSLGETGEGDIYIGVFALVLVLSGVLSGALSGAPSGFLAGAFARHGSGGVTEGPAPPWQDRLRLVAAACAAVFALIAVGTLVGSWAVSLGPLRVSVSRTAQPLTAAAFSLFIVGITSPVFAGIVRRRSTFAFYAIVAVMTWSFSLGPRPKLFGQTILYRGPYELLMLFPGFDNRLRVPARFVMITVLAVATAAGIGLGRLTRRAPRKVRFLAAAAALLAITADSWTFTCPMPSVPPFVQLPNGVPASAAVLELPLGQIGPDIAAVYQSIGHRRRVVNGYSGYTPQHYRVLQAGLQARDHSVLAALTSFGPIVAVIARENDPDRSWTAYVERGPHAVPLAQTATHAFYLLPAASPGHDVPGALAPIRQITSNVGPVELKAVTDGDPLTFWSTPHPQRGGEELILELDRAQPVSAVTLATGSRVDSFPRRLDIATSIDARAWEQAWTGGTAGAAIEAALRDPRTVESRFVFPERAARFVRLRQLESDPHDGWVVAEIAVHGGPRAADAVTQGDR